jgi:hypothetical protein
MVCEWCATKKWKSNPLCIRSLRLGPNALQYKKLYGIPVLAGKTQVNGSSSELVTTFLSMQIFSVPWPKRVHSALNDNNPSVRPKGSARHYCYADTPSVLRQALIHTHYGNRRKCLTDVRQDFDSSHLSVQNNLTSEKIFSRMARADRNEGQDHKNLSTADLVRMTRILNVDRVRETRVV